MDEYEIGQIVDGKWRYLGGDPKSRTSWETVEQEPDTDPEYTFGDKVRTAAQGLTFGFGDEIESFVTGRNVDEIRAGIDAYREAHPIGSTVTEMAGGLPLAALGGLGLLRTGSAAARTAGLGTQMLRGAAAGGAAGTAYGAGVGTDRDSRVTGAVQGGLLGTVVGGALPAVTAAAGSAARGLKETVLPGDPNATANRLAARAIVRDGISQDDLTALVARADPEDRLADIAGENTRRAARGAMAVQNDVADQADTFLTNRRISEAGRINQQLTQVTDIPDSNVPRLMEDLKARMRTQAKPAYDQAYASAYEPSDEVMRLVSGDDPAVRRAYDAALRIARREGVELEPLFNVSPDGQVSVVRKPNVQMMDYLKRGLDDQLDTLRRGDSSVGKGELRGIREMRNTLVADVDDKVPAYRAARRQYAGDIEVIEALEEGGKSRNLTGERLDVMMGDMSQAEQEAFRLGWLDSMRRFYLDRPSDTSSMARNFVGNEKVRKQFQALFGSDARMNDFFGAMRREVQRGRTANAVQAGSRTAPLQQDIADMTSAGGLETAVRTGLSGRPMDGLRQIASSVQQRRNTDVAGALSKRLLLDPPAVAFRDIIKERAGVERGLGLLNARRGGYSIMGGLLSGRQQR